MPIQQEVDSLERSLQMAYCDECNAIRQRRRTIEERMLMSRRQWFGSHLARVIPDGMDASDLYDIPAARRTEERFITRAVDLMTPNVQWFQVSPMGNVPEIKVTNVDAWMAYCLRKRISVRPTVSQLARSLVLYDFCVLKTSPKVINQNVWPSWRAVDDFSFYIYPETSPEIEEAEKVFEDKLMSLNQYKTFFKKGIVTVDLRESDLTKPEWPYHLVERLAYQGITDPTADVSQRIERIGSELEKTTEAFVSCSELWLKKEDVWYQCYIVWNHKGGPRIVGFFESEYDYPLYRMAIHRPLPGELYTVSQASDIDELDNVQNDLFNMFMSSVDWEQGFMATDDSQRNDSWVAKGRAIWRTTGDPREAIQLIQPPTTSANQLRAFQIATALMQSMGGAGSIAEGQPGRNMPRAGFAMQTLVNLGLSDIQDVAKMIEEQVLTKALSDIYKITNFIPDDQLMRIPGGIAFVRNNIKTNVLYRQDVMGDYEFEWVGSQQFQDEGIRAQRAMIFFNVLTQPQVLQMIQQQGYQVNIVEMIQYIWRSTLGERGLSKIIVPLQQPPPASPQEVGQLAQQAMQGQNGSAQGGASQRNGSSNGVQGLNYNLPQLTQGFVQRGG